MSSNESAPEGGLAAEQTKLWKAVRNGSLARLREALAQGASAGAAEPGDGGAFPIHRACFARADHCLREILESGASLAVTDDEGSSPLHFACTDFMRMSLGAGEPERWCDRAPALLLLSLGESPRAVNKFGQTPLHCAAQTGFDSAAEALLAAGASPEALTLAGELPEELAERCGFGALASRLRSAREAMALGGAIGPVSAKGRGAGL